MKLIGLVVTRNHFSLDEMPVEAARSLIPICDTVVVSDMQSDDGSWGDLEQKLGTESKVKLQRQPWEKPHNDPQWWVKALNHARERLDPADWVLQLDADEVLGTESYSSIRLAVQDETPGMFRRYTFWRDAQHLVPWNKCCGEMVARLGPANLYLPSDEPNPAVHPNIRDRAEVYSGLHIYHYGMIRYPAAFVAKSEVVQNCFFGGVDPRIHAAQEKYARWDEHDFFDGEPLRDFVGQHPEVARPWLLERGYRT
jgi:hypothetical protein